MGTTQIILLVVGIIVILTGISGIANKTRKGRRWTNLLGETGAKIFYAVIGISIIVLSFFV